MNWRKWWRAAVVTFVVVQIVRVVVFRDKTPEDTAPGVPDPTQHIVLKMDGMVDGDLPFTMNRLNVYVVEDESNPETFEFEGDGIHLVGKIPVNLHVGYDEAWSALVDKPIAFSPNDVDLEAASEIHLPEMAPCTVTGGAFTIQKVGETDDAKTPLEGELWLRCSTPAGERILRGTFTVKGTTWG